MRASCVELARDCGGRLRGDGNAQVSGVSTDSRSLRPGALFVALRGERFDGHRFVADAVARGAAAVLASDKVETRGVPLIRVADTTAALGALASTHRARFDGPVVAITGSNGKTTSKEMCAAILEAAGLRVRRSPGNYNNEIGLPLSILGLEPGDDALVVELGMNHPGEILALATIAAPDVGAITQVAPAHLGPVGSLDAIARAKGELLERIGPGGTAVLNADDAQVAAQAPRFPGHVVWFGCGEAAEVRAEAIESSGRSSRFRLTTPGGSEEIALECPGRHMVWNALCAVAAARAALARATGGTGRGGEQPDAALLRAARAGLAGFRPVAGRMALRRTPGGALLLDDSYNANPVSSEAALRTLAELDAARRVAVLGDMLELGRDAEALHERVGAAAASAGVDLLVAVGELGRATARAARREGVAEVVELADAKAAAALVPGRVRSGDAVLVKGSRGIGLERVVAALLGGND